LVVETDDGQPAAHALVELRPGPLLGGPEGFLVDSYVPAAFKGQGWSQKAWSVAEWWLAERGVPRVEGTIGAIDSSSSTDKVLASLLKTGWWHDRTSLWMRALGRADPPVVAAKLPGMSRLTSDRAS
jgi:hypothetical protein